MLQEFAHIFVDLVLCNPVKAILFPLSDFWSHYIKDGLAAYQAMKLMQIRILNFQILKSEGVESRYHMLYYTEEYEGEL